jgi:hypothetical protein
MIRPPIERCHQGLIVPARRLSAARCSRSVLPTASGLEVGGAPSASAECQTRSW